MPIHPYRNFDGNCREVVNFYARVFKTPEPKIMTFAEAGEDPEHPLPPEAKNLVMHTSLEIAGTVVMFSDTFPGSMPLTKGNNVSLTLVTKDRNELESAYHQLSEGGQVSMPLQETFWSKAYGALRDRYGTEWQFDLDSGETF